MAEERLDGAPTDVLDGSSGADTAAELRGTLATRAADERSRLADDLDKLIPKTGEPASTEDTDASSARVAAPPPPRTLFSRPAGDTGAAEPAARRIVSSARPRGEATPEVKPDAAPPDGLEPLTPPDVEPTSPPLASPEAMDSSATGPPTPPGMGRVERPSEPPVLRGPSIVEPPVTSPPTPPEGPATGTGVSRPPAEGPPVEAPPAPVDPDGHDEITKALLEKDLTVGAIDVSKSQEQRARQLAQERLMEGKAELEAKRQELFDKHPGIAKHAVGRAFLGAINAARDPVESVFRQNLFRSATLEKYKYDYLTGDRRGELAVSDETRDSTVDRFAIADRARVTGDTEIFDVAKHAHEQVLEQESPDVLEFKRAVVDLIRQRVEEGMDEAEFQEAKDRLMAEKAGWIKVRNGKDGEKHIDAVDTITQAAEAMVKLYEHTKSMDLVDHKLSTLQLVTGEARIGARAEMKLTRMERITESLTRNKVVGRLVPDQTLAVAVTAAGAIATRGATSAASKAVKWGTLGAGAGISAVGVYQRERLALRQERTTVERQMAVGDQTRDSTMENSPLRAELTNTIFDMVSASEIMESFRAIEATIPAEGRDLSAEEAASYMDGFIQIQSMIAWGDTQGRDVVRYSSEAAMDQERLQIDVALVNMRGFLKTHYEEHPEQLPEGIASFSDLAEMKQRLHVEEVLESSQAAMDKKYDSFSRRRATVKAAATVVGGAVSGLIVKEGLELVGGKFNLLQTERAAGPKPMENQMHAGFGVERAYPKDWEIKYDSNSHGVIIDSKGTVVADAQFDPKTGVMAPDTVDLLEKKGIRVETKLFKGTTNTGEFHTSIDEFSIHQPRVKRFWQDNDTAAQTFDQNELDTHVRLKGDSIVVDVRSMAPGGSFHNGRFVNAPSEFGSGNGKLLFSLDKGHQSTPFQMDIATDGTVRLPLNSSEARNLFDMQGGKPSLKAAYMEVASGRGIAPDGTQQYDVLSTVVGKNTMTDVGVYDVPVEATTSRTIITAFEPGSGSRSTTDVPFLFLPPPLPRYGLENLKDGEESSPTDGPAGVGGGTAAPTRDGAPGAGGATPDRVTPTPGASAPLPGADTPETNNKAYTQVTEVPIDEAWRRHFEQAAARMDAEENGQDSFWEFDAAAPSAGAVRLERSRGVDRIARVIEGATPGFAVDQAELLERLRLGIGTSGDWDRLSAEAERARAEATGAPDRAEAAAAEELVASLRPEQDPRQVEFRDLLHELGSRMKAHRDAGAMNPADVDMTMPGLLVDKTKAGERLTTSELSWLQTTFAMISTLEKNLIQKRIDKKRVEVPDTDKRRQRQAEVLAKLNTELEAITAKYGLVQRAIDRFIVFAQERPESEINTVETGGRVSSGESTIPASTASSDDTSDGTSSPSVASGEPSPETAPAA